MNTNETNDEKGLGGILLSALSVIYVGFHVLTAGVLPLSELHMRSIHVGFSLFLVFVPVIGLTWLKGRAATRLVVIREIVLGLVAVVAAAYIFVSEQRLIETFSLEVRTVEIFLAIGLILLLLEGARRTTGPILPTLTVVAIAYALFGELIPGWWGHPGFSATYVVEHLYLGSEAIWGLITGLSAGLIAVFIMFGCFLLVTGAADTFMDIALIAAGRSPGGAAKVSTIASAFFGMVNGAAVANVATTGNFTIPAMKRLGYRPAFAGAVEAVASSGGQITPPIMGSVAFVMAEILEIPYATIVIAATIPALLFYVTVWFSIDVEARKLNLRAFDEQDIPAIREVLRVRKVAPLAVTITVLLVGMFSGQTLTLAAFYAIMTNLAFYLAIGRTGTETWTEKFRCLLEGARLGTERVATLVPLLVCAQITLSLITFSGFGIKLSELILSVGLGHGLLIASFLTLVVSMVLGMGMPTTAAYLLASAVCAPALSQLGVPILHAHLFVFYGALLSALTPPVCTAVFTASIISQTHWWPIALESLKLAVMKYTLPFFFIFRPALLMEGDPLHILWATIAGIAAAFLFALGTGGFYRNDLAWPMRGLLIVAALGVVPGLLALDLIAITLTIGFVIHGRRMKHAPQEAT
jgi:TRAP transporter 4TM/12TM fusion protein